MIRNERYLLKKIEDKMFLWPTGQDAISGFKVIELNQVGLRVWEMFAEDISRDQVANSLSLEFSDDEEERKVIYEDVSKYITDLAGKGVILHTGIFVEDKPCQNYMIGGLLVKVYGLDKKEIKDFDKFAVTDVEANDSMSIHFVDSLPALSKYPGHKSIDTTDVEILETKESYQVFFKKFICCKKMSFLKGSREVYIEIPKAAHGVALADSDLFMEEALFAARIPYSYYTGQLGMYIVHSVSILYKDKIWLLSAAAGVGKSTHAAMWKENSDAKIINGDSNLIVKVGENYKVSGIPWCGTSNTFDNKDYELGGIILLTRSKTAYVEEMTKEEKTISLTHRLLNPLWDKELLSNALDGVGALAKKTNVFRLYCNVEKESYEVLKDYIDKLH